METVSPFVFPWRYSRQEIKSTPGPAMAENVMESIVAELRTSALKHYPQHPELKNVRVVGHTPKSDHFIYDIVIDFEDGSERLAVKVYRSSKSGQQGARNMARKESEN